MSKFWYGYIRIFVCVKNFKRIYSNICSYNFLDTNIFGFVRVKIHTNVTLCSGESGDCFFCGSVYSGDCVESHDCGDSHDCGEYNDCCESANPENKSDSGDTIDFGDSLESGDPGEYEKSCYPTGWFSGL